MLNFLNIVKHFNSENSGSISIMGSFLIPVVALSVMASVEFSILTTTKQKIQRKLDAVALSAVSNHDLLDSGASDDLQEKARAMVLGSIQRTHESVEDVVTNFTYDASRDLIVGEVTFSPKPNFFGAYFLPETIRVSTEAAPLRPFNVEISLALDLSGSMNFSPSSDSGEDAAPGSRRVDALREGVYALVNSLDGDENIDAKYAVVPYATSVDLTNVAASMGNQTGSFFVNAAGGNLPNVC